MTDCCLAAPDLAAIRGVIAKWHIYRGQLPRVFNCEIVTSDKELERENVLIDCFLADLESLLAVPPARPEPHWKEKFGWEGSTEQAMEAAVAAEYRHDEEAAARPEPITFMDFPIRLDPTMPKDEWKLEPARPEPPAEPHDEDDDDDSGYAECEAELVMLREQVQALQQRVDALQRELETLQDRHGSLQGVAVLRKYRAEAAEARLRDLQTALQRYGRHESDCMSSRLVAVDGQIVKKNMYRQGDCTCGLKAALASLPASATPRPPVPDRRGRV